VQSDPKSAKTQSSHCFLFAPLVTGRVKAAHKTLEKSTPECQGAEQYPIIVIETL